MQIEAEYIYLIIILENVRFLLFFITLLGLICLFAIATSGCYSDNKKFARKAYVMIFLPLLIAILIPSKEEMVTIYALSLVNENYSLSYLIETISTLVNGR